MKKLFYILLLLGSTYVFAQNKGMTYQAVIYAPGGQNVPGVNVANLPLANRTICLQFSLLDATSAIEYQEVVKIKTDEFGMVNITIGSGTQTGGYATSFAAVVWSASADKSMKVALDATGLCNQYEELSVEKLDAVPFANAAITAGNVSGVVALANGGTGATTAAGARTNLEIGNVDNTSDLNKPMSTATKTYIDGQLTSSTIVDADASTKGKIQLAGDLAGTAAAPTVPGLALKENAANKSTATTLGTSNILFPTQNAVKTYVDTAIAGATIVDADASTKGKIQLAGDLAGTAAAPTVPGLALKENAANKSTTTTLGTSNVLFPTQNAVKTYVDTAIAGATIVDADANTKGKIQLAGDLSGTAAAPTVPGLALKLDASLAGVPNGVATLNSAGIIPANQLPPISVASTNVVSSQAQMLALSNATVGSIAVRTDVNKNFILSTAGPSVLANWVELLTPGAPVQSVNGLTGAIQLSKTDINLANVDNTTDAAKPVSTATQNALNLKLNTNQVGVANGTASLNALGKIPTDQIPAISFSSVKVLGSQAEMLAQTNALIGSVVIRTDVNKNYVLAQTDPSILANWLELLTPAPPVQSVNGYVGNVSLTKADLGLADVDNTGDINKPVSTATQNALDLKANLASPTFTGTVGGITKSMVGLANVDNTTDLNKPVSTPTQNALDLKANLASPTFSGTVSGITKAMVGLGNVDNTTDAAKPVSTATQTALDLKANAADVTSSLALKANLASPTFTGTVSGIDKTMVGLGNVDNTTDAAKPVSTATQTALNLKANAADVTTSLALKEDASNKSTITTLGTSDSLYPTQNAVKTYVDTAIAGATIVDANATTKGKIQLAGDLTGAAASPSVATGAITSAKILDGTIANDDIADGTISAAKLVGTDITTVGNLTAGGKTFTFQDLVLGNGTTQAKISTDDVWKSIQFYPNNSVESTRLWPSGNVTIQHGGTYTDNGYTLEVGGTTKFAGNSSITGTITASSGITGTQFTSTTATGTAPFVVTSTTPVANLNIAGNAANVTGTVAIANGGTGQTTKTTAFDALSPMTTAGDIMYGATNGTGTRLAKGNDGQILKLVSGLPSWQTLIGFDKEVQKVNYGSLTGYLGQGNLTTAVGPYAGQEYQGDAATALGRNAGNSSQGAAAVAVGQAAGAASQGAQAVAIGNAAGASGQGAKAIAIGELAGYNNQHANSIILNATGNILNSDNASALYIAPIRSATNTNVLLYNPTTKEVTTSANIPGNAANVTGTVAIANGGTAATTAAAALTNLGAEPTANKSTATNLGATTPSDDLFPTQKAVKAYVDAQTAAAGVSDGSITSAKILDGTIAAIDIADGTITGPKLNTNLYAAGKTFTFQDLLVGAGTTFGRIATDGTKHIAFEPTFNVESTRFWANGNITIQTGGTFTDNGYKLEVAGTTKFGGNATITGTVTASSGITGTQFTSTIATGTAPFVVTSTTPVANLSIGGNAATVTTNANLTGDVTSSGNATTIGANKVVTGMIANANVTNAKLDKTNIPLSGFGAAAADVALGSNKLTGVADPTLAQDAATKNYVDIATAGITTLADGKIYLGNASNVATEVTPSGDVTMTNAGVTAIGTSKVVVGMLATDAVETIKIKDANVTAAKLATDAVETLKIKDANVTAAKLAADAVETLKIKDANVTYAKIQNVATGKVLGRVSANAGVVEEIATTGTGDVVRATSPTLVTPVLGAATATTINKVTITQPTASATLTIADGKTLTANNSIVLAGTDATTMTFPTTDATIARTDAAQTFTGVQTFSSDIVVNSVNIGLGNGAVATNTAVGKESISGTATGAQNSALGYNALKSLTSGNYNTAIGSQASQNLSIGSDNTALGYQALKANMVGSSNTAIGKETLVALSDVMTNSNNTAVGTTSFKNLVTGSNSVALGKDAGSNSSTSAIVTSATNSIFVGADTKPLGATSTNEIVIGNGAVGLGNNSTVIGNSSITQAKVFGALDLPNATTSTSTTTGALKVAGGVGIAGNTFIGGTISIAGGAPAAGKVLTSDANGLGSWTAIPAINLTSGVSGILPVANGGTGSATQNFVDLTTDQTIAGIKAFSSDIVVNSVNIGRGKGAVASNTAVGKDAISATATGTDNAALGYNALKVVTSGNRNTAVGSLAATSLTTGNDNSVLGFQALKNNTTGASNVAIGKDALFANTGGNNNVAIGRSSLVSNTTGISNVALGLDSALSNTTGNYNLAVGQSALRLNTTGVANTAIGGNALYATTTGNYNSALGWQSLAGNTTGIDNVAVGYNAGTYDTTGTTEMTTSSYSVYLGSSTKGLNATGSVNETVIGNAAVGLGSNSTVIGNTSTTKAAIYGALSLPDLTDSTSSTTGALKVAGGAGIDKDLNVGGKVKITGTLEIDGGTPGAGKVLTSDAAGLATWSAIPATDLAAGVTGTLPIANGGTGSATQNFVDLTTAQTVAGAKTFSGNTSVGGTFAATGATTLSSTLAVTGNTTVGGTTTLNGNTSVSGTNTFTVGIGATTIGGTLAVTGATTLNGNTSVSGTNTLTVGTGATALGGTLAVTGATTLNGNTSVSGTNTFTVGTGATALGGTLAATGATTLSSTLAVTGNTTVGGTTTLNGNTSVSGSNTLTVGTGATALGGTLAVNGATTLSSTLDVTGNTVVSGTLKVAGGTPGLGKVLVSDANGLASWSANSHGGASLISATATMAETDTYNLIVFSGSAASQTITLPSASLAGAGREITIKNIASVPVTINATAGNLISDSTTTGATSLSIGIEPSNNWIKAISDGTNWIILRALF